MGNEEGLQGYLAQVNSGHGFPLNLCSIKNGVRSGMLMIAHINTYTESQTIWEKP